MHGDWRRDRCLQLLTIYTWPEVFLEIKKGQTSRTNQICQNDSLHQNGDSIPFYRSPVTTPGLWQPYSERRCYSLSLIGEKPFGADTWKPDPEFSNIKCGGVVRYQGLYSNYGSWVIRTRGFELKTYRIGEWHYSHSAIPRGWNLSALIVFYTLVLPQSWICHVRNIDTFYSFPSSQHLHDANRVPCSYQNPYSCMKKCLTLTKLHSLAWTGRYLPSSHKVTWIYSFFDGEHWRVIGYNA